MQVGNDGGWCGITVAQDGKPYDAGLLTQAPEHGKVYIHPVGDATRIDYTPDLGSAAPIRSLSGCCPAVRCCGSTLR